MRNPVSRTYTVKVSQQDFLDKLDIPGDRVHSISASYGVIIAVGDINSYATYKLTNQEVGDVFVPKYNGLIELELSEYGEIIISYDQKTD